MSAEDRENNDALKSFFDGVTLSARELETIFERHQIKKITPAIGDVFSYNHHQAVSEIASDDYPSGTIVQLLQHGYILYDRLIRPAMVVVSKGK